MRRREFIPIGAALGAFPSEGASPSATTVCPKSRRPARTLCAVRLEDITRFHDDLCLTLACLQGIVNRSRPRLYLVQDRFDELWLDWLRERGDIDSVEWLEIGEVFGRFLPEVRGMFVADTAMPATINVATMLASVHDGFVATERTASQFKVPIGDDREKPERGLDLRKMAWKTNLEAYRWAFSRLEYALSRQAISILDPAAFALRDYLVEFRIPVFWVAGPNDAARSPYARPEEEERFAREILLRWPPNIPCMGWPGNGRSLELGMGEERGVALASACAKFQICCSWDNNSLATGNVSVHSGTSGTFRQKAAPVRLERDKIYYSFVRTDGDGWNFHRHYYRKLFEDPQHGKFPVAWHVGPTALDAIPDLIDWFFKHASPGDSFVNALTGIGYIIEERYAEAYPPEKRDLILREYMRLSGEYRARLGSPILVTHSEMRPALLERFARIPGVEAILANYVRSPRTNFDNIVTEPAGVPVFRAISGQYNSGTFTPAARREVEAALVRDIRQWTPPSRPAFLNVVLTNWFTHMEMGERIINMLGSEYVAVRPEQLVALYRQARGL